MIKQILLALPTYPDAPSSQCLEGAAFLAHILGASLTVQIPQLSSDESTWPPVLGAPLDFPGMMNEAVLKSEKNAELLAGRLTQVCSDLHLSPDIRKILTTLYPTSDALVDLARLHDLLILPVPEIDSFDRHYVEAVVFNTGRPTLLLPSGKGNKGLNGIDKVVVAWDYSREASRALADALPLLMKAKQVHILSVLGEKGLRTTCALSDLEKYLAAHQVKAVVELRSLKDGRIADLLSAYAQEVNADVLVMGAYGHSRFHEFILGGATQGILSNPTLPVLLSH